MRIDFASIIAAFASLAGRALHIAALAGLLAPLGACDGGGKCVPTDEPGGVAVNGVGPIGSVCSGSLDVDLEGIVRNDAGGRIVVDSCHPNDTCAPMESVLTLSGTDLSVSIPDGTFVRLHVDDEACEWDVMVRNLPTWGGTPNPTSDGTFLWLAHVYIFEAPPSQADDPYQTQLETVCAQTGAIEIYAFRFLFPDAPGAEVVAPPGQTVTWSVPEGEHAGEYRVRNLQAMFEVGETEPTAEFNYWIARK